MLTTLKHKFFEMAGEVDAREEINDVQDIVLKQANVLPVIKNENNELNDKLTNLCMKIKETERKTENLRNERVKERAKVEQIEYQLMRLKKKLSEEEDLSCYFKKQLESIKKEEIEIIINHESILNKLSQSFREEPNRYEDSILKKEVNDSSERLDAVKHELENLRAKITDMNKIFFYPGDTSGYEILKHMIQFDLKDVEQNAYNLSLKDKDLQMKIKKVNDDIEEIKYRYGIKSE